MNRYHLVGNQNELIEKLSLLFIKGKPVNDFPPSYKGINDQVTIHRTIILINDYLPEEAKQLFEGKMVITAILFEFKNFFNPIIEIDCQDRAVIYITIGSLFSVGSKIS